VCGQNGQVIHKILEETLVIIEVPPADSPSEIVTLRGFTEVSVDGVVIWLRDHARVPVDVVSESKEIRDKSGIIYTKNEKFGLNVIYYIIYYILIKI
jgi:hypothetical protein